MHKQASKTQIPPYGLSWCRRPNSECPPSIVHNSESPTRIAARRHPSAFIRLRRAHTIRMQARWGFAALSAFFLHGDLDLWMPKGEKTCPDSRPTRMQNFMPLAFSAAEKSVTVQRNKKNKITHSKLSIPHINVWWDNNPEQRRFTKHKPHASAESAHVHSRHPRPDALHAAQSTVSKHWRQWVSEWVVS